MTSADAPNASRPPRRLLRAVTWLPRKVFSFVRRHAITLGLILLALVVAHTIAVAILAHQVESALQNLRQRGEPIAARELVPAKIPDRENGAVIFAQAFKLLPGQNPGPVTAPAPVPPPAPAPVGEPGLPPALGGPADPPQTDPAVPGAVLPAPPPLTESQKADLVLSMIARPEDRVKYPRLWSKAGPALQRVHEVLALAEQALNRPRFQFPVRWQDGSAALFPHPARLRGIARYACAAAIIEAHKGNSEAATRYLELAFGMTRVLEHEPALISQLVRYAIAGIAFEALEQVLSFTDLSQPQRNRLDAVLSRVDFPPGYKRALQGERAISLSLYRGLMGSDWHQYIHLTLGVKDCSEVPWWFRAMHSYPLRPLFYRDELVFLRVTDRLIRQALTPYRLLGPKDREPFDRSVECGEPMIPFAPICSPACTGLLTGFTPDLAAKRDCATARVALSRTALAILDYRERVGAYPDSLNQVQSKLGRALPEDPFSGKPLIYRRQGKGFLIYSVGQDLKDDHGRPAGEDGGSPAFGDIVLKRNR